MPQYTWTPVEPEVAQEPETPYSWRGIGAGALRGLSGLLSGAVSIAPGVGTPIGAAIGGAGELGAELLEGSEPSWKRIGVEAGLGAVPGGKLISGGKFLQSALRSGAFSGLGALMRQKAQDQELDLGDIALQTGIGGTVGGGIGKLLGLGAAPAVKGTEYVLETTAQPGGRVLGSSVPTPAPRTFRGQGKIPVPRGLDLEPKAPVAYGAPATAPSKTAAAAEAAARKKAQQEVAVDQRQWAKLQTFLAGKQRAAEKLAEQETNAARIAQAREGLEMGQPRVSESYSAPIPGGGRESLTIPYRLADDVEDVLSAAPGAPRSPDLGLGGPQAPIAENPFVQAAVRASTRGAAAVPETPASPLSQALEPFNAPRFVEAEVVGTPATATEVARAQAAAEAERRVAERFTPGVRITPEGQRVSDEFIDITPTPVVEDVPGELAQLFRTRVGTTGKNYRLAKDAVERGEIPSADFAREAHLREQAALRAQRGVAPETPRAVPSVREPGGQLYGTDITTAADKLAGASGARPMTPDEVAEQLSFIDRIKRMGSEKGAASPELLTRLGLGAAGALVGGATDPLDNPILSALAGAGLGAAAPNALNAIRSIGVPESALQDPNLTVDKLRHLIPQYMRFNYLTSSVGLPANAWAGPYGSAVMGALEHGLAGDPRGWAALQELNPVTFGKEAVQSWKEAAQLIGRAEGESLTEAPGVLRTILATPGTVMTGGDIAARKALMRAGFDEATARRITLTSEPELRPFKRVAGFTKGSPELQTLMPFSRTPANIMEQGLLRTPGIGALMQARRDVADPLAQQLVQQGLGAAVGVGAGAIGAGLDPETAKYARRYVTNAAGQYSLPASVGFAVGQAVRRGKPPVSGAINEMAYALPLPTVEPVVELGRFLNAPSAETVPNWAYPAVIREMNELGGFRQVPGDVAPAAAEVVSQPRYIWR